MSGNDPAGDRYGKIYAVVARIPRGRVASYGQVAVLAGLPGRARQVGTALASLPDGSWVPWHRVVNAAGKVSLRGFPGPDGFQRHLLEEEGVPFSAAGRIDLEKYGWRLRARARRRR